jgi:hypothetical protein
MKIAIIFATDGPDEDSVVAPFRSSELVGHLRASGINVAVASIQASRAEDLGATNGANGLHCRRDGLAGLITAQRPNIVQTFGRESRLVDIWPLAAHHAPVVHCVSSWRRGDANTRLFPAAARLRKASRHVRGLMGTSRSAIGDLIAAGWFSGAAFSVVVPPPVEAPVGPVAVPSRQRAGAPVFGLYDAAGSTDDMTFMARAIALIGPPGTIQMRIATKHAAAGAPSLAAASVALMPIAAFLATVDVLVVPVYDDSAAPAIMAALRAGKSLVVPDASGAAELVGYGRHGTTFPNGSAYHLATAMNMIHQAWSETPPLATDATAVIERTSPAAVAQGFAAAWRRLASGRTGSLGPTRIAAAG